MERVRSCLASCNIPPVSNDDICCRYWYRLQLPLIYLYSLFIWYLWVIAFYFPVDWSIWIVTGLVALIIGFALNLNFYDGKLAIKNHIETNVWICLRFFAVPFCVSSYSGAITYHSDQLFLIFPRNVWIILAGAVSIVIFWIFLILVRLFNRIPLAEFQITVGRK